MFTTFEHCLPKKLVLMKFYLPLKQKGSEKNAHLVSVLLWK